MTKSMQELKESIYNAENAASSIGLIALAFKELALGLKSGEMDHARAISDLDAAARMITDIKAALSGTSEQVGEAECGEESQNQMRKFMDAMDESIDANKYNFVVDLENNDGEVYQVGVIIDMFRAGHDGGADEPPDPGDLEFSVYDAQGQDITRQLDKYDYDIVANAAAEHVRDAIADAEVERQLDAMDGDY